MLCEGLIRSSSKIQTYGSSEDNSAYTDSWCWTSDRSSRRISFPRMRSGRTDQSSRTLSRDGNTRPHLQPRTPRPSRHGEQSSSRLNCPVRTAAPILHLQICIHRNRASPKKCAGACFFLSESGFLLLRIRESPGLDCCVTCLGDLGNEEKDARFNEIARLMTLRSIKSSEAGTIIRTDPDTRLLPMWCFVGLSVNWWCFWPNSQGENIGGAANDANWRIFFPLTAWHGTPKFAYTKCTIHFRRTDEKKKNLNSHFLDRTSLQYIALRLHIRMFFSFTWQHLRIHRHGGVTVRLTSIRGASDDDGNTQNEKKKRLIPE